LTQIPIGKGNHAALWFGITTWPVPAGGDAALIVFNNDFILAGGHIPDPDHALDVDVFCLSFDKPNDINLCEGCFLGRESYQSGKVIAGDNVVERAR